MRQVGILELIHQHVLKAVGVFLGNGGVLAQQARAPKEQVVEIHGVVERQQFLVALVNLGDHLVAVGTARHVGGQA